MDGWWDEIDAVVRKALEHGGEVSAAEIACRLGVSEAAAASLLGLLVGSGTVRIVAVAAPAPRRPRPDAAA